MDCWCESAENWHNCVKYNRQTAWMECRGSVMEKRVMETLKCHPVGQRRVSSVALVAGFPAEPVCPPGPGRALPPLSELFPWQWRHGGHTWSSSPLFRDWDICGFTSTDAVLPEPHWFIMSEYRKSVSNGSNHLYLFSVVLNCILTHIQLWSSHEISFTYLFYMNKLFFNINWGSLSPLFDFGLKRVLLKWILCPVKTTAESHI